MDYAEIAEKGFLSGQIHSFCSLTPITYLVINSGGTKIRILVHWKQRIVELDIEYSFDP